MNENNNESSSLLHQNSVTFEDVSFESSGSTLHAGFKDKDIFRNKKSSINLYNKLKISLASSEDMRKFSYGEVLNPETINYRTSKPEKNGLFCAKIFGPVKDYECLCGKYRRMKYRGIVCERCGVEVTKSSVRRERMGHIELAVPVVHIWFLKNTPSRIGTILDIPMKNLESVLYCKSFIVVDEGISHFDYGDMLNDDEYMDAIDEYGEEGFKAMMGGAAIKYMLQKIDLETERSSLRDKLIDCKSDIKRKKIVKKLRLIEDFVASGNKLEWMVIDVLPVIPPDLRPLVALDGGRFASSDLNEFYRRVINRNNRLKRLIELRAPNIILRNEQRMLQEAVDALFDNSKKIGVMRGSTKRPLKSLSDMLKGKSGRFRQNLLGKRVDYSGRSVIVVGPQLKLHQCGIPKRMALELFKPMVYAKLELYGYAVTIKAAKKIVENERPEVWDVLEEVIHEHPVLLNRAPTLHRLGIQAFDPILVEGKAIQLHPLVCTAFNADFDGDQMAVHVPISIEAQIEARVLMMSVNNIISPSSGKSIIVPSNEIVLGLYYMTLANSYYKGQPKLFRDINEVEQALFQKIIHLHDPIHCRVPYMDSEGNKVLQRVETTAGRVLLSKILPESDIVTFNSINQPMTSKRISKLFDDIYKYCGTEVAVHFADNSMALGFEYSTSSGVSLSKNDMLIPNSKSSHIEHALSEVKKFEEEHMDGLITASEKYNRVIDTWGACTTHVASDMMEGISGGWSQNEYPELNDFERPNSVYLMAHSGARGSETQIRQIAGMRGLMAKSSGKILETPILSNFREGLTVLEYFNSIHGARKGLTDTALKTANSGYLTRRLVDVAQDFVIATHDCGATKGININPVIEDGEITVQIDELIVGRTALGDIVHPETGAVIVENNYIIEERVAKTIREAGIVNVTVRSVLRCKEDIGVCAKCYGIDVARSGLVNIGEAVGVIAAQSIGEPGTQLTMQTFHIGGAAQRVIEQSNIVTQEDNVKITFENMNIVTNSEGQKIVISRNAEVRMYNKKGKEINLYKLPYGSIIFCDNNAIVKAKTKIAEWDHYTVPIITEKSGKVVYRDLIDTLSVSRNFDEYTGLSETVVTDWRFANASLKPRLVMHDENDDVITMDNGADARYFLPINAILTVENGEVVQAGTIIAKIPIDSLTNRDITGGLPRVAELFEARRPKDTAIMSEISGFVEFDNEHKKQRIIITSTEDPDHKVEYLIPRGKHVLIHDGDMVSKGDLLTDGVPMPQDILSIMGIEALAKYMIEEIQKVYRLQGVSIRDVHIEVILRQMLQKMEVIDPGDTTLFMEEQIYRDELEKINEKAEKEGYKPVKAQFVLQGITKASLQNRSFISAASFQETTKVLTEASIAGKIDHLAGLKENVIVGHLVPSGTGHVIRKSKQQVSSSNKS